MKFCFFGNVSGALKGKTLGGGELQISLLAKALALKGHEVVIIDPYADENFITLEGIKLVSVPEWKKGPTVLRMFLYRIPALRRMFREQNADFYIVRMRSYLHLIPYLAAKKNGGKFIQSIASDIDVLSERKKFKYDYNSSFKTFVTEGLANDVVFNYLLRRSNYVLLQHCGQRIASTSSKNNQIIFSNLIELSALPVAKSAVKSYYIYAGSLTTLKGSDNLLKLINIVDQTIPILIVGSPKDEKSKEVYKELSKKKNVIVKGQKTHKETVELIADARALINTSYYEGFPNIYLEAWGMGVPVISLNVNPGNVLTQYNLGVCCFGDLNRMKRCMEDEETKNINREKLTAYVNEFHDSRKAAVRFLNILKADLPIQD